MESIILGTGETAQQFRTYPRFRTQHQYQVAYRWLTAVSNFSHKCP